MSRSLLQLVVRHAECLVASVDAESDAALLQRFARNREEAAFSELLRRHGPLVWAVCRQSLPGTADAEDAFQATFLVLIRSPESVRSGVAIAAWLHGVAVRVVGKLKRSAVRRKQREERAADLEADAAVPEYRWDALIAAVHEEVQRLPAALRTAFVLCELEGKRQPDVAEQLGWKPGTLTSRLSRARQRLIERLSQRGLAPAALGTLSLSVATANAHPPAALFDSTLKLLSAGPATPSALLSLAQTVTPMTRTKVLAATLLVACGFCTVLLPASPAKPPNVEGTAERTVEVVAEEKAPTIDGPSYVPHDSALFAHIDMDGLWNGSLGKSLRDADAKMVEELAANTKRVFGVVPADLKAATIFVPSMRREPTLGVVLSFRAPYDKAKLKAGLVGSVPGEVRTHLISPSDTVAILLVNLDPEVFGKPQKADASGPLTSSIRAATAGKHLVVVGSTLENLPDSVRNDMLPNDFQPLLKSDSISALVALGKELTLDVRVKAPTAAAAADCSKAFDALLRLAGDVLAKGLENAKAEPGFDELKTLLQALRISVGKAKVSVEGTTARATISMSADLPFALAYLSGKRKVLDASARSRSTNNLKQIGLAMHNYHDVHGTLPPAAVCDKTGKPMLSWRVLILPYIEQDALYKKFKLDEPWDSENNKKLLATMPRVYADPTVQNAKASETTYRVFVGNGAAFNWLKGGKLTDFTDGTSKTFLVATGKDSVPWTKPDELEFDPQKDATTLLGFHGDNVCLITMADGSVLAVSKAVTKKAIHASITAAAGDTAE